MLKQIPQYECLREAAAQHPELDPSACEAFLRILGTGDTMSRAEAAFLSQHGLSQGRLIILMLLEDAPNGQLRSSELADHAGVSRATITGLLDSLERDGLIQRSTDPNDRRVICATLTPDGSTLLRKTMPVYFQWVSESLQALTVEERIQFSTLLDKIQKAFPVRERPEAAPSSRS